MNRRFQSARKRRRLGPRRSSRFVKVRGGLSKRRIRQIIEQGSVGRIESFRFVTSEPLYEDQPLNHGLKEWYEKNIERPTYELLRAPFSFTETPITPPE